MRPAGARVQHDASGVLVYEGAKLGGALLLGRARDVAVLHGVGGALRTHRKAEGKAPGGGNRGGGDRFPVLVAVEQGGPAEHVGGGIDGAATGAAGLVHKDLVCQGLGECGRPRLGDDRKEREGEPRQQRGACEGHASGGDAGADRRPSCGNGHVRFLPGRAGWGGVSMSRVLVPRARGGAVGWRGGSRAWHIVRGLYGCAQGAGWAPRRAHAEQANLASADTRSLRTVFGMPASHDHQMSTGLSPVARYGARLARGGGVPGSHATRGPSVIRPVEKDHGPGGDALLAPHKAETLGGGCLDAHP